MIHSEFSCILWGCETLLTPISLKHNCSVLKSREGKKDIFINVWENRL